MAAFRKARELGADGVELDVRLAADDVPVVMHSISVDETTDGTGRVADHTLAELKALDAGGRFSPQFAGERIPTLAEVFDALEGKLLLNVELKDTSVEGHGLEAPHRVGRGWHHHRCAGCAECVSSVVFLPVSGKSPECSLQAATSGGLAG